MSGFFFVTTSSLLLQKHPKGKLMNEASVCVCLHVYGAEVWGGGTP